MNNRKFIICFTIIISLYFFSCFAHKEPTGDEDQELAAFIKACPLADAFDFPVGPPNGKGYYNAQPFGKNYHLGEDWNGNGGGNSDLGDPIFSIANGIVIYSDEGGPGWGNVVRIIHNIGTHNDPVMVESLYAHLKTVNVSKGVIVKRRQRLGTIGNVNKLYYAHLHLEIRTTIGMPLGEGYSTDNTGFTNPTQFIKAHRSRATK